MGDRQAEPLRSRLDRHLRLEFHGANITSDAGRPYLAAPSPGHGHSTRVQCVFRSPGRVPDGEVKAHPGSPGKYGVRSGRRRTSMFLATILSLAFLAAPDAPLYEAEFLFPPEPFHNHSSSIVETPGGDLIACWFHGKGERTDDTLVISGARKSKGQESWSAPFLMADNKNLPDQNCTLFIDPDGRLWLFWISSIDNLVRSYFLKYRYSTDYEGDGPPVWTWQDAIFCRPRDAETAFVGESGQAHRTDQGVDRDQRRTEARIPLPHRGTPGGLRRQALPAPRLDAPPAADHADGEAHDARPVLRHLQLFHVRLHRGRRADVGIQPARWPSGGSSPRSCGRRTATWWRSCAIRRWCAGRSPATGA